MNIVFPCSCAAPVFLTEAPLQLRPDGSQALAYGHVRDGNVHLDRIPPAGTAHEVEGTIFDLLDRHGGSIRAGHGIGRAKRRAFPKRIDPVALSMVQELKARLDPGSILSPGLVLGMDPIRRPDPPP